MKIIIIIIKIYLLLIINKIIMFSYNGNAKSALNFAGMTPKGKQNPK
jgi:hypothetical protein